MPLRDTLTNNVWWKLLSLLLAAAVWLTIQTSFQQDQILMDTPVETTSKRQFPNFPVALLSSPANSYRYSLIPPSVDVEITGSRDALTRLKEREIKIYVDLGGVSDEKQVRRPVQWQCPAGVEVTSLSQGQVIVERLPQTK